MQVALNDKAQNAVVEDFRAIIAEELNVKQLEVMDDVEKIATVKYAPFFDAIRAKYPTQIPLIIKAIKSNQFKVEGDKALLNINGEYQAFDSDVLLVTYAAKSGMHVAGDKGVVVSLDMTVTEELRREGLARDIVRRIQDARKQLGCEITDRITISVSSGNLPEGWQDYICGETLSTVADIENEDMLIDLFEGEEAVAIKVKK